MKNLEWTKGNEKVPFRIVNLCSARECPSRRLGLCQCPSKCYADKAERQYPDVLPFRRRQAAWWSKASVEGAIAAADSLEAERSRARSARMQAKVLRFSEAGDFLDQGQLNLFAAFAARLIAHGWTVYGYTARVDLDLIPLLCIGVKINLSGDSSRYAPRTNRFRVVQHATGEHYVCCGDCAKCSICQRVTGKTIEVEVH